MLYGEGGGLGSIGRAQLGDAGAHVMSNRGRTDRQALGYLPVCQPIDHQSQHFPFALAEVVAQFWGTRLGLEQGLGDFRRKRAPSYEIFSTIISPIMLSSLSKA